MEKPVNASTNNASKTANEAAQNQPAVEQAPTTKQEADAPKAVGAQPVDENAKPKVTDKNGTKEMSEAKHKMENTGRQTHAQKISNDPAQPSSLTKPTQI